MKKQNMGLVWQSLKYALVLLFFSALSVLANSLLKLDDDMALAVQAICFLLSSVAALFIMKSKQTFASYGVTLTTLNKSNTKKVLWFLPLVAVEAVRLTLGFDISLKISTVIVTLIMMLFAGISEELFFRGLILKTLEKKGTKYAILSSSVIFSLTHLGNLAIGTDSLLMLVQIVFAIIFGFVAAEIAIITKTIIPLIIWHVLHNFIARTTVQGEINNVLWIILIQCIILAVYALYLWIKGVNKQNYSE